MAAGGEAPIEQGEVADAAVRWQVVKAAGIVDQVVRAAVPVAVRAKASPQRKRTSAPASRARSCAQATVPPEEPASAVQRSASGANSPSWSFNTSSTVRMFRSIREVTQLPEPPSASHQL
jgi:hypothetical protein